jgi:hypothetical protein
MAASGELDETILVKFLQRQQKDEFIVALARLSSTSVSIIAQLLNGQRNDAILLPCKAAGLSWPTVQLMLRERLVGQSAANEIIEIARNDYAKLTTATAQRTLRFMKIHETVS